MTMRRRASPVRVSRGVNLQVKVEPVRKRKGGQAEAHAVPPALDALYGSAEYLIRRAHQLATASFAQACADLDLTPSQYATLFALRQYGRVGQNEVGRLVALDRSTTSLVVRSLRERSLVTALSDASDRRKTFLEISNRGRLLLAQAEQRSARANEALLSMFSKKQAAEFLAMLHKMNSALAMNDVQRS